MRILLVILMICLFPVFALANPFLVCDPQAGVTNYHVVGPAPLTANVTAQTDGSLKMDVANAIVGLNSLTVSACITDPLWGEACSATVPFAFTRPASPKNPAGIGLVK